MCPPRVGRVPPRVGEVVRPQLRGVQLVLAVDDCDVVEEGTEVEGAPAEETRADQGIEVPACAKRPRYVGLVRYTTAEHRPSHGLGGVED